MTIYFINNNLINTLNIQWRNPPVLPCRSSEVKDEENTMLFVTKCPCDECVPLILGAGIKQIYTTDLDSGKDKGDISYLRFSSLPGVQKFIVSSLSCASALTLPKQQWLWTGNDASWPQDHKRKPRLLLMKKIKLNFLLRHSGRRPPKIHVPPHTMLIILQVSSTFPLVCKAPLWPLNWHSLYHIQPYCTLIFFVLYCIVLSVFFCNFHFYIVYLRVAHTLRF